MKDLDGQIVDGVIVSQNGTVDMDLVEGNCQKACNGVASGEFVPKWDTNPILGQLIQLKFPILDRDIFKAWAACATLLSITLRA